MNPSTQQSVFRRGGFTLIETLTVLAITAALLAATLQMYQHVRRGVSRIAAHLDENRLSREVLQKIAEDIDRLAAPGFDATIEFRNKYDNGFNSAQLRLENKYQSGDSGRGEIYESVVWQTSYDPFSQTLILYRMHEGLNREDRILSDGSDVSSSDGLFVPVTDGVTHFEMQSLQDEAIEYTWVSETLPTAVRIGISFAPLEYLADGRLGVPEEKIDYRVVAVDRTRFIPYRFIARKLDTDGLDDVDLDDDEEEDDEAAAPMDEESPPEDRQEPTDPDAAGSR